MEAAKTVLHQVAVMFLLIGVGIVVKKKRMVTLEATQSFSGFLLKIVVPALLIRACRYPIDRETTTGLAISFGLAVVFHLLAISVASLAIRRQKTSSDRIARLGVVYSNCGFMSFPLLSAVGGDRLVFYGAAFVAVFNIFLWTHGLKTLSPGKALSLRKILFNPGLISVLLGMAVYFLQLPIPAVLWQPLDYLADLNTPLAMVITGIFLADIPLGHMLKNGQVWLVSLLRTLATPLLFLAVVAAAGLLLPFPQTADASFAMLLCAACPAAASIILLPASLGMEGGSGAQMVAVSTLLSIVTLPAVTFLVSLLA